MSIKKKHEISDLSCDKWCPLFGWFIQENNDFTLRNAAEIIREARNLVATDPVIGSKVISPWYQGALSLSSSRPELKELPHETHKAVVAARSIWEAFEWIERYALNDYRSSRQDSAETLDVAWKEAINEAQILVTEKTDLIIEGDFILAVLAINEVWSVLQDVFYFKTPTSNPQVLKDLLVGKNLLSRAKETRAAEEKQYYSSIIKRHSGEIKCLEESKRKGAKKTNDKKREKGEQLHRALKEEITDITSNGKRTFTINRLTELVKKREKDNRLKNENLKKLLPGKDHLSRYVKYVMEECWGEPCTACQKP